MTFKGNRREFFTWAFPDPPARGTHVIVDADRGEDLGVVNATGDLAARRKAGTTHGKAAPAQLRAALRAATADDIAKGAQLRADEDNVRRRAIDKVRAQRLEMKVSDAEWQWDRKKLTIYFTAEKRVDFRQLVRQLEGVFGARVQMWHIGVRDEARRLDGIGRCARQFCSAGWLPGTAPRQVEHREGPAPLHAQSRRRFPARAAVSCAACATSTSSTCQQRKRFPKEGQDRRHPRRRGKRRLERHLPRAGDAARTRRANCASMPLAQLNSELGGEMAATDSDLAGNDEESGFEEESAGGAPFDAPVARCGAAHISRIRFRRAVAAPAAPPAPACSGTTPAGTGRRGRGHRRRRRRGRRGGRRGREGGGPPEPTAGD